MRFDVITIFPDMFSNVIQTSIIKRAIEKEAVSINVYDFRLYSNSKHKKVDDTPYGGGAGMVISVQPIVDCLKSIPGYRNALKILTSASGITYTQEKAFELAKHDHIIIICGHYEGIDSRILNYVDIEISVGDYVLTGGEIPAMIIMDSIIRLIPTVLNEESIIDESYSNNLLEYDQYTKPPIFDGYEVPEVLTSGNHEEIRKFRRYSSLKKTFLRRPDLLNKLELSKEDLKFLEKIKQDI